MSYPIKHISLYCGVVNHVFKHYNLPYLKFVIKNPITHKVSTETAVASDSINMISGTNFGTHNHGIPYLWVIRHLQTIRHVACETNI